MKWRLPAFIGGFGVCTMLQEQLCHFGLSALGGPVQRRAPGSVTGIHLVYQCQQKVHHFSLTVSGSAVQNAFTALACGIGISAVFQKHLDNRYVALLGSPKEAQCSLIRFLQTISCWGDAASPVCRAPRIRNMLSIREW